MKDLDHYPGETYGDSCQLYIMKKTSKTFPNLEIPKIIPDMGSGYTNTYGEMNYLKKRNIDKDTRQKLRKKDAYETDMYKI